MIKALEDIKNVFNPLKARLPEFFLIWINGEYQSLGSTPNPDIFFNVKQSFNEACYFRNYVTLLEYYLDLRIGKVVPQYCTLFNPVLVLDQSSILEQADIVREFISDNLNDNQIFPKLILGKCSHSEFFKSLDLVQKIEGLDITFDSINSMFLDNKDLIFRSVDSNNQKPIITYPIPFNL